MSSTASAGEVLVIGDLLLDVMVRPSAPIRTDADVPAAVTLLPGGQGGNVAVWLARRGRAVRLLAPLANDAAGTILRAACTAERIALTAIPAMRTGTVVILLDGTGRRTMLSDRATLEGRPEPDMREVAAIVCSGYALLDPSGDVLARSLSARHSECQLAVACCALGTAEAAATIAERLSTARPDLFACNVDEASALLGRPAPLDVAARELGSQLGTLAVVTDPQRGSAASRPGMSIVQRAAAMRPPVDTTGAGDAYVAALLDAMLDAAWPPTNAQLHAAMSAGAALAASVVVTLGAQAIGGTPTAGGRR